MVKNDKLTNKAKKEGEERTGNPQLR